MYLMAFLYILKPSGMYKTMLLKVNLARNKKSRIREKNRERHVTLMLNTLDNYSIEKVICVED